MKLFIDNDDDLAVIIGRAVLGMYAGLLAFAERRRDRRIAAAIAEAEAKFGAGEPDDKEQDAPEVKEPTP